MNTIFFNESDFGDFLGEEYSKKNFLFEGGNAYTKNGDSAEKIEIAKMSKGQYDSYKKDIVKLIKAIASEFKKQTGKSLFPNDSVIDSFSIFSGSGNSFFKQSYEDYTRVKSKLGDIDVQIDQTKKDDVVKFLANNEGKLFNGFKYLGSMRSADLYNVFKAPAKYYPQAKNIQIDFEFIEYDENGNPNEFDMFTKNSEWEDISAGIKGLAKQGIIPCIYKVVYHRDGVLFTSKGNKPAKNQGTGNFPVRSYGFKGSREKFVAVLDDTGKQVEYEGKPAFREVPVKDSVTNRNLDSIFEEIFKHKPSAEEKKMFYSYQGCLQLIKKNFNKKEVQKIYDEYLVWLIDNATEDMDIFKAINNKFKEVFPYVKQSISDEKIAEMTKGEK
jgi:hypothetical protein